jgi:hypothetical protein
VLGPAVLWLNHSCSICILMEASDGYLGFSYLLGQMVTLALARQARELECPL